MPEPSAAYPVRGPLLELTRARIRELTREPEALFWVFVFPILLTSILGLAFRSRPPEKLPVAVAAGPQAEGRRAALAAGGDLAPQVLPEAEATKALERGRVVLVVSSGDPPAYAFVVQFTHHPRDSVVIVMRPDGQIMRMLWLVA